MSYSHNRLNLTPGSLYVDKLAVRHILPIDQANNEYSTNTIFAVAPNGELEGYNPAVWFSSIGYTDPSTIQGQIISTIDLLNAADQSTVAGLGSAGYISTATLNVALQSTVAGLTTSTPVSVDLFYNTLDNLANTPYNYISSTQLQSTVAGLGSAGYVSTIGGILGVKGISTGSLTTSTVTFRDIMDGQEKPLYSQGGNLYFGAQSLAGSLDISVNSVTAPIISTLTINAQNSAIERRWAAVGLNSNVGSVSYSTDDGASWSSPLSVFTGTINRIKYIAGRWYAMGQGGSEYGLKYSVDGVTWQNTNIFPGVNAYTITYNGSYYVAGGDGPTTTYISTDGITFTAATDHFTTSVRDILYNGSQWIAVGADSTSAIKTSKDGINWSNTSFGPGSASSIATNGHTIVVGLEGAITSIYYSTDGGITWITSTNSFTNTTSKIVWNTSYYVAVGDTIPYIKYSRDGKTWSDASGTGAAAVNSVFWNGRTHRSTTSEGTVYQSVDGITWATTTVTDLSNQSITYSIDTKDVLIAPNVTLYGVDVPHYYNSTSQIYAAPDALILNDTLNVRRGTVGVMKGDPSVAYHLDVEGAINASTIYVSSVQMNDLLNGQPNRVDFVNGQFRVNGTTPFQSTVAGLGSTGYVSTSGLTSTVAGLGQIYVSSTGYLNDMQSTVAGLGQTYVSTPSLTSTVAGLGQFYVSTPSLTSTVAGLGQFYISTPSLASTVAGLGSAGYVSTATLNQRFGQAVISTLRLTTQMNQNTPYTIDLNNTSAFPTMSSILRVKDTFNTNIISEYKPQILIQGFNNGATDYENGLALITDSTRAQLALNKSTFIELYNEKIGINQTLPAATLDISGDLNVSGNITCSTISVPLSFTNLEVTNLTTSTLYASLDTTIEGNVILFTSSLLIGNANSLTNAIRFYGTYNDNQIPYTTTVIAERVYEPGTEKSEMLIYKGNDIENPEGPDRIRHLSRVHQFDITATADAWYDNSGGVPASLVSGALYINQSGQVGINTTSPTTTLDVSGTFKSRLNFLDVTSGPLALGSTHYGSYVVLSTGYSGTITFPATAPEGAIVVLINDSGGDRTIAVTSPATLKGNTSTTLTNNSTRSVAYHGTNWYGL